MKHFGKDRPARFHKGQEHGARRGDDAPRGEWLYGRRPILESLRAGRRLFHELLVQATAHEATDDPELAEIRALAASAGVPAQTADRVRLDQILGEVNHQGVALRAGGYPYGDFDQLVADVRDDPEAIVLFLDHIEDPQNVGSLLRTADAAGAAGVVLPSDRASGVTAAAVRASAGAAEHLRVCRVVNLARAIEEVKEAECWITGLDWGEDAREYTDVDFKGRCGIVVGSEGHGIGRLVREKCDFIAQLPMQGQVASLNAAVAGAIALYEAVRQKRAAQKTGRG